jgi:hypothetical protein
MDRFKWPVPSEEFFRQKLTEGEGATIEYRIERYIFLWEEFAPPARMLLVGGIPAMFALDELKRSYAYGNFMATVLLAQAFIEQTLGGSYMLSGQDEIAQRGFAGLIAAARDDGKITAELANEFDHLRRIRNPYTHNVSGLGPRSYMGRLKDTEFVAPEDLVMEDAKFAVRCTVNLLRAGSPAWNPGSHRWDENTNGCK